MVYENKSEVYPGGDVYSHRAMAGNLSQPEFCRREGLPYHIFLYWLKKFRKQERLSLPQSFIPVKVAQNNDSIQGMSDIITIDYPNGVQVHYPFHLGIDQIRNLIKL